MNRQNRRHPHVSRRDIFTFRAGRALVQTVGDAEAKLQQVANADEKLRKQLAAIGRLLEGAIANESWSSVTAALGTLEAIVAGLSVKAYGTGS